MIYIYSPLLNTDTYELERDANLFTCITEETIHRIRHLRTFICTHGYVESVRFWHDAVLFTDKIEDVVPKYVLDARCVYAPFGGACVTSYRNEAIYYRHILHNFLVVVSVTCMCFTIDVSTYDHERSLHSLLIDIDDLEKIYEQVRLHDPATILARSSVLDTLNLRKNTLQERVEREHVQCEGVLFNE